MNLQSKIVLGGITSIIFTTVIMFTQATVTENLLQSHISESDQNGLNIAHLSTIENTIATLENQQVSITRNRFLKKAIKRNKLEDIADEITPLVNGLSANNLASDIFVIDKNFKLLYASDKTLIGQQFKSVLITNAMTDVKTLSGLGMNIDGKVAVNTVIPINARGRVLGGVIIVQHYEKLMAKIKGSINGDVALYLSDRTNLISATDATHYASLTDGFNITSEKISIEDSHFEVTGINILDNQGNAVANLVCIVDATEMIETQDTYFSMGILVILLWLALSIFTTYLFAGRAFKPLVDMVEVAKNIEASGNLSLRIDNNSTDEIGQAASAVNKTLDAVEKTIAAANKTLGQVAEGNFSVRMSSHAHGDLKTLEDAVNQSVGSLDRTMQAILVVVNGIDAGDFSVRMDPSVEGSIKTQVDQAMNTMSTVISEINNVLAHMAKGDFTQQVRVEARGELKSLATNVNERVEQTAKALDEILHLVSALSKGDLTKSITANFAGKFGEVGSGLNTSLTNLSKLISQTNQGVFALASNANQIHQGTVDLNERTAQQAETLQETTQTMSHITQAVKDTSANASKANQLANAARTEADAGAEVMQSTIKSMADIRDASHKIEEIITLIDGIAFQTNLLALNAAVEAARAGDHGRGFAVVAGEVRNLAGKSADAARDIKALIENAVAAVDQGTEHAEGSDKALKTITKGIRQVSKIVSEITSATEEQSSLISQVGQSINELDSVTSSNATLVKESSAASETMKADAEKLTLLVQQFKV